MVTEGGKKPPGPVTVSIDAVEDEFLKREGHRRAKKYENRTDKWGMGFRGEAWRTFYEGFLAELAFAKWMNKQMGAELFHVDFEERRYGDGGIDFHVAGISFDVKGVGAPANSLNPMLIMRMNGETFKGLSADIYVAVSIADKSKPALMGWVYKEQLNRWSKSPRSDAMHWNVISDPVDWLPMSRLPKLVKASQASLCGGIR